MTTTTQAPPQRPMSEWPRCATCGRPINTLPQARLLYCSGSCHALRPGRRPAPLSERNGRIEAPERRQSGRWAMILDDEEEALDVRHLIAGRS